MMPTDEETEPQIILSKLDATRDLAGTFFAPDEWKVKYEELR